MINVVAAIITKDRKVLIARRAAHKSLAGKWEFPGGKVEDGESPEIALEREIFEEFEVHTKTKSYIGSNRHNYEHISINLMAYFSEYISGDWELSDHDRIEWVDMEDLLDYDLAEADLPIVGMIQID